MSIRGLLLMKRFLKTIIALAFISFALGIAGMVYVAKNLPDPTSFDARQVAQSTKIYDRTGKVLLYEIYGEEKRTVIPFDRIPTLVKQATIAIEDSGFYHHPAIDWRSVLRALWVNIKHGRVVQGGSTITQQLAKNAFLSSERTLVRKAQELILAFRLERKYNKDKILDLYLNQIPYGANAYGIEAAAQTYFNKTTEDLTMAETALLVSLPKAPTYYSPYGSHTKELFERKDMVLEELFAAGAITAEEQEVAQRTELTFTSQAQGIKAPHFVLMVQDYLTNRYGEDVIRTGGLAVTTTLDWDLQQTAEEAVTAGAQRNSELYAGKNAALVAQDARTGQILALVGSRDYFDTAHDGNFNVASQGLRQPGSAIKPFAYITAFKKGFTPDTMVFDLPTEFDTSGNPEKSYQPQNFDEFFRGPVTFRQGLAQSINVPSVKVLYLAGVDATLKTAKDFGITTLTERSRYGLSLVLGGGEIKLIELVGAYSVFSQEGVKHQQALVLKVEDKNHKVWEEYKDRATTVINPQYPRLVNSILADREARSPLFQNSLHLTVFPQYDVALKTGTTNNYRDAWALGYTPTLIVGVWAGNNDNQPMQRRGGSILAAVPIWHEFMTEALKQQPLLTFTRPEPIVTAKPVLNGSYVINNQVHDILYYVAKNDPQGPAPTDPAADSQFENWEKPIAQWVAQNQDLIRASATSGPLQVAITAPTHGSFVTAPLTLTATLNSATDITKIEIYINDALIEQKLGEFGTNTVYQTTLQPLLELQNKITVKAYASSTASGQQEIIVYRNF